MREEPRREPVRDISMVNDNVGAGLVPALDLGGHKTRPYESTPDVDINTAIELAMKDVDVTP